ncbi:MAG: low molecular weight protein-tyrosine-phosphatase [Armatimonadota bacterium]
MPKILFVCLGNICRSPMAESIFRHKVDRAGLTESFVIESAGTGDWHVGDNPDPRTIRVLAQNGVHQFSRARQFRTSDFVEFDQIIAMDLANERDLRDWNGSVLHKVTLMASWGDHGGRIEVPDPYYGDFDGFEEVFEMLDSTTDGLLVKLTK